MALTKDDLQAIAALLEPQFGLIGQKFEAIDQRFDTMDQRFESIESRLDVMDQRFETIENRLDTMDRRFVSIENRLDKVESEVSALKAGQLDIRKDIKNVYDFALDAWGTSQENRKWLETAHI